MTELMRAVGYRKNLPVTDPDALLDLTVPVPEPGPHDLRVTGAGRIGQPGGRQGAGPAPTPARRPRILGFDAAGRGGPGWARRSRSSGRATRSGTPDRSPAPRARDAELHLVDERITGPKPATLDFAEAAAPAADRADRLGVRCFDRLRLTETSPGSAARARPPAGGVGSILVQMARRLTRRRGDRHRVAARKSRQYVLEPRARTGVVDHHGDLAAQLPEGVDYVFSPHSAGMADTLRPDRAAVRRDRGDRRAGRPST